MENPANVVDVLLRPAAWLTGRLNFRRKLLACFVAFAVPLLVAVTVIGVDAVNAIEAIARQRAGLALQLPAFRMLTAIQDHFAAAVAADDRAAAAAVADFERQQAGLATAPGQAALGPLRAAWNDARAAIAAGDPDAVHERAIETVLAWREAVVDASGLGRLDDPAAQALVGVINGPLPRLAQSLGLARNLGLGVIARQRLTPRLREELSAVRYGAAPLLSWIRGSLDKAAGGWPQHRQALDDGYDGLGGPVLAALELLTTKVINSSDHDVSLADYDSRGAAVGRATGDFAERLIAVVDAELALAERRLRRAVAVGAVLVGVLLLALAYVFAGAYHSIMGSLRQLETAAATMASGDLRASVALQTRDELAQVGAAFNRMAESFRTLIERVAAAARETEQAAGGLSDQATAVSAASAGQSEMAAESASAVQQLAVSVNQVAAHAADTRAIVGQAAALSDQGQAMAARAEEDMLQVIAGIDAAVAAAVELEARSRSVAAVVGVIAEIAGRTNLLALNAAIEAARAGETGRGFAVVADEVRKLADRTRQSTAEIEAMIAEMQAGIAAVVERIRHGSTRVADGSRSVGTVASALASIDAEVRRSSALIGEIVAATNAQSEASQEIARNIERMATMAEGNRETARGTVHSVDALNHLSGELRRSVGELRV